MNTLINIKVPELTQAVARALLNAGLCAEDAKAAAQVLVTADTMGLREHGVSRLESYMGRLRKGGINPHANIVVNMRAPSLALVDGDNGLGPVVGTRALNAAIDMAGDSGIAYVGCRHSNHFAALAPYALRACESGYLFIGGTNAAPSMSPWKGREARLGNNPLCIAAPCPDGLHFILDMAMSVVARGKIRAARDLGRQIPEGWAIDQNGSPTSDPVAALSGLLLPMGAHKGSGLSLAVDILSGVLTGARFLNTVSSWVDKPEEPSAIGHFFLLIDPARLIGRESFADAMSRFRSIVQGTPPAGDAPVTLPGYQALTHRRHALEQGIEIPARVLEQLA